MYSRPQPASQADLALMRGPAELQLAHPFLGSLELAAPLGAEDHALGRRHARTLMARTGPADALSVPAHACPGTGDEVNP